MAMGILLERPWTSACVWVAPGDSTAVALILVGAVVRRTASFGRDRFRGDLNLGGGGGGCRRRRRDRLGDIHDRHL